MTSDIHIAATKKLASIIEGQVVDGIVATKKTEFVDRMITIRDDQDVYLKGRRDLNFSGWVQKKIDEELMGKR